MVIDDMLCPDEDEFGDPVLKCHMNSGYMKFLVAENNIVQWVRICAQVLILLFIIFNVAYFQNQWMTNIVLPMLKHFFTLTQ